ncbi:MAG: DNA polymerase III subunit delta' [Deltaproteobacteria bacterium]|nr:MAG: DNA polymerase III subunit delta' [Deltaproteobacteria bacterium]
MSFAEVIGQQQAVNQLASMAGSGKVPAALLLAGMEGVGKCFTAYQLAQVVNCRQSAAADACGTCPDCRQIARRVHPDVLLVEAEKNQIKIDQVREIHHYLGFAPLSGRFKVVIINDAHLLNGAAANALLKTLEEPPAQTIFLLVTHRQQLLLPTILSRCITVMFKPLSRVALKEILSRQGTGAEARLVEKAVALSGGSISRARYFLDTDNLSWRDDFLSRIGALTPESYEDVFALAEEVGRDAERIDMTLYLLETFFRDALVLTMDPAGGGQCNLFHPDLAELLQGFAAGRSATELLSLLEELNRLQSRLLFNINIRLALEALLMKLVARR